MKKILIKILCLFIPTHKLRRKVRRKLRGEKDRSEWSAKDFQHYMINLSGAIADPKGLGMADFIMNFSLHIKSRYKNLFYNMPHGAIVLDCGVNRGKFIDLCNIFGARIYGFEPNPNLFRFLEYKYRAGSPESIILTNAGVGAHPGEFDFYCESSDSTAEGFSMYDNIPPSERAERAVCVKCKILDLCEFIKSEFISKNKRIYLIKLDIEDSEFGLIEKLIETGVYKHCDNIVVETHQRFFENGDALIKSVNDAITAAGATNIDLEWI